MGTPREATSSELSGSGRMVNAAVVSAVYRKTCGMLIHAMPRGYSESVAQHLLGGRTDRSVGVVALVSTASPDGPPTPFTLLVSQLPDVVWCLGVWDVWRSLRCLASRL